MSALTAGLLVLAMALVNLVYKATSRFPWVLADSYTHLLLAEEIRRRRSWVHRLDRYLYDASVPDPLDYPPAFPMLLATLYDPAKTDRAEWLNKWLPPILDTMGLVAAAACAAVLCGAPLAAVASAMLWLTAPCTQAQTVALSGRPLGVLLATLTFSATAFLTVYWSWLAAMVALVAGTTLVLTSRLAIQAWAILALAFALFGDSWTPLALLCAALFTSGVVTRGLGWRVHAGHWRHMRRLRRLMPKKRWHQLARFSARRSAPPPQRGLGLLLRVVTFLDLPWVWLVPFTWILGASLPGDGVGRACLLWLLSLIVAGALIQAVPGLRFIGEGFRYFEFAIVPLAIVVTLMAASAGPTVVLILAVSAVPLLALSLFQITRNARGSWLEGIRRDERAVALARRVGRGQMERFLVMPLQYASLLAVESGAVTLMMLGEVGADRSEDFYPVMESPPRQYVEEFKLDGIFLDRRYAGIEELALPQTELVDEEGPFAAYRLTASRPKLTAQG